MSIKLGPKYHVDKGLGSKAPKGNGSEPGSRQCPKVRHQVAWKYGRCHLKRCRQAPGLLAIGARERAEDELMSCSVLRNGSHLFVRESAKNHA